MSSQGPAPASDKGSTRHDSAPWQGAPIGPPPDLPSLLLKERRYLSGLHPDELCHPDLVTV